MPELPEVEAVARTLRPLVTGQLIRHVHVLHVISTRPQKAARLIRMAERQRVVVVGRRGKYLVLKIEQGLLTIHFRLDGQLLWFTNGKELLARANTRDAGVHVDVDACITRVGASKQLFSVCEPKKLAIEAKMYGQKPLFDLEDQILSSASDNNNSLAFRHPDQTRSLLWSCGNDMQDVNVPNQPTRDERAKRSGDRFYLRQFRHESDSCLCSATACRRIARKWFTAQAGA